MRRLRYVPAFIRQRCATGHRWNDSHLTESGSHRCERIPPLQSPRGSPVTAGPQCSRWHSGDPGSDSFYPGAEPSGARDGNGLPTRARQGPGCRRVRGNPGGVVTSAPSQDAASALASPARTVARAFPPGRLLSARKGRNTPQASTLPEKSAAPSGRSFLRPAPHPHRPFPSGPVAKVRPRSSCPLRGHRRWGTARGGRLPPDRYPPDRAQPRPDPALRPGPGQQAQTDRLDTAVPELLKRTQRTWIRHYAPGRGSGPGPGGLEDRDRAGYYCRPWSPRLDGPIVHKWVRVFFSPFPGEGAADPAPKGRAEGTILVKGQPSGRVDAFGAEPEGREESGGPGARKGSPKKPYSHRAVSVLVEAETNCQTFALPSQAQKCVPAFDPACRVSHGKPRTPPTPIGASGMNPPVGRIGSRASPTDSQRPTCRSAAHCWSDSHPRRT